MQHGQPPDGRFFCGENMTEVQKKSTINQLRQTSKQVRQAHNQYIEGLYNRQMFEATALDHLNELTDDARWLLVQKQVNLAAYKIRLHQPFTLLVADHTPVGGKHIIEAAYDGSTNVTIGIPENPGQFPTLFHTLEIIGLAVAKAHPELSNNYWPAISYIEPENISQHGDSIVVPLTVDPERTNAVLFHPKARKNNAPFLLGPHEDPGIAEQYWEVVKDRIASQQAEHIKGLEGQGRRGILRHTIFLQGIDLTQPKSEIMVIPNLVNREAREYSLFQLQRLRTRRPVGHNE